MVDAERAPGKPRTLERGHDDRYNPHDMAELPSLTDATFDEAIQASETPVLVEFWNHG